MSCSKLFSGDLPELTSKIIQYFKNDYSTLYSCILINRLWCRLAIPLLWENPFSTHVQNYQFIEIYLHSLNEDDKAKFNEYGINSNLFLPNTLFNYPGFIKCLSTHKIVYFIESWLVTLMVNNHSNRYKVTKLVYRLLFNMFIENEGNLHSFEIRANTINDYKYFNDTMELTLQKPNFISNIRSLMFHINIPYYSESRFSYTNVSPFLNFLFSNCNSISSFYFGISEFNVDNFSLIRNDLSKMVISQKNLKKISFECNTFLYDSFSILKNSNCSNTLNTITFYFINFRNIITIFQEVFDQLNVLESIHIIYCYSLNSEFIQQIISVTRPFEIRSLFIDMGEISQVEPLELLLQKFGGKLENFGYGRYELINNRLKQKKQQLFKLIIKYCAKIKYFDLGVPDIININLTLDLIENIKQNLNYLNIQFNFYEYYLSYDEICTTILKNLGQILPSKLEYLNLCLKIKPTELKIFLENSQNTFIKKLFIRNIKQEEDDDILPYIKEYIMKKKRVKYLAILNVFLDLFTLKDEVDEFKLYNIKVQKYKGFYLEAYDFVNNFI
ncbi:hypothetical protein RclHR1_04740013 [Rhizophagus clarus]|uniref:F-box domain-containing protein n=1 Tax=Rhizophagus clarus TaxID=94130 RepID=A0A2Z6S0Q0_9GLOM|nr:hypothetical protein RclHR1_04740013 [Rhizophagus clarus]GES79303.1 hypothetical protein GLOIN_2v1762231 [Rhizophagus clarus]